jgi:hypothetical protein
MQRRLVVVRVRIMLKQEILRSIEAEMGGAPAQRQSRATGVLGDGLLAARTCPAGAFNESVVHVYRSVCASLEAGDSRAIRCLARAYERVLDWAPAGPSASGRDSGRPARFHGKATGRSRRKASGSFYTPARIIRYMVSSTLGPVLRGRHRPGRRKGADKPLSSDEILGLRVLDPAMGSGLFLFAVTEYLARAYGRALVREGRSRHRAVGGKTLTRYMLRVARDCVYGVDVSEVTVHIARLLLGALTGHGLDDPSGFTGNLKCGNALLGPGPGYGIEDCQVPLADRRGGKTAKSLRWQDDGLFRWESEFPDVFFKADGSPRRTPGFDVVIGNPPYLSFSGRQKGVGARCILAFHRALGRTGGWVTTHGLFMMRSLELAGRGGLVSMIVPDQVGHLAGYGPVRAWMLEHGELLQVRYWGEGVFADAVTPSLTFVIRKEPRSGRNPASVTGRDGRKARFVARGKDEWYVSPAKAAVDRIRESHRTLGGFSDPGIHTGNVARKLVLTRRTRGSVPVLEGRQVHPFRCDPPVKWLKVGYAAQPHEYFRISSRSVYEEVDIILRQTADRPIAARHIHRCHFRNSVLALKVPEGFSVEYVLGILNSEAACWIYQVSSLESLQRAFPQVKIGRLRALPIPDPTAGARAARVCEVEAIVRKLESKPTPHPERSPLMQVLNRLVWDIYGLSRWRDPGRRPPA